jgi:hypothetical protein
MKKIGSCPNYHKLVNPESHHSPANCPKIFTALGVQEDNLAFPRIHLIEVFRKKPRAWMSPWEKNLEINLSSTRTKG